MEVILGSCDEIKKQTLYMYATGLFVLWRPLNKDLSIKPPPPPFRVYFSLTRINLQSMLNYHIMCVTTTVK